MPSLSHLPLVRAEYQDQRRKQRGPRPPPRNFAEHGGTLQGQLSASISNYAQQQPPSGINPELILRIKLHSPIEPKTWAANNLRIVGQTDDGMWVLFASNADVEKFTQRLTAYQGGPQAGRKGPPHVGIFANINEIGRLQPNDRIGRLWKAEGVTERDQILSTNTYTVDVELWPSNSIAESRTRLQAIKSFVVSQNGRFTDEYVGVSLVLGRIKASGTVVQQLLEIDAVATIDLTPKVSLKVTQQFEVTLQDLPPVNPPEQNATGICVIDSGIANAHPLLAPAVGEASYVPARLATSEDENGHGTRVAGLALYGDVSQCIENRSFVPTLRLFSVRVLNNDNKFDDEKLITTQMTESIETFKRNYGCRIFNLSLGDDRAPFTDSKVSTWASILDHLARQHDIVIVVSAGNYLHEPNPTIPETGDIRGYPRYLLEPPARVIEPGTGAIVLTVGSLASSDAIHPSAAGFANLQPIARTNQPSPFTRCGPGIGGSVKPEVCELGGNFAFDALSSRVRLPPPAELSIVSLNRLYRHRLFAVDAGTSFAAPRVAYVAAKILQQFPSASANLIRALIVSSARVPNSVKAFLNPLKGAVLKLCGYGVPSLERAVTSEQNRVVMYAEDSLPLDMFHVFEVPIPSEFYSGTSQKRIGVTLAFDPPVRHTRLDYIGTTMAFRLIRGKSIDEVVQAFKKQPKGSSVDGIKDSCNCSMVPGANDRDSGTLQHAVFSMTRGNAKYGDTYYVVVRCERGWALDEHAPQRYAIVVSLESDQESVEIYSRVQARVQSRIATRVRI